MVNLKADTKTTSLRAMAGGVGGPRPLMRATLPRGGGINALMHSLFPSKRYFKGYNNN